MKTILVTGAAGFIGAHLTSRLTAAGATVVGLDNLNDYYDPQLKRDRMAALAEGEHFIHENLDLANKDGVASLFERYQFDAVVNLAAQAGVRYSLVNPHSYVDTNLVGFLNTTDGGAEPQVIETEGVVFTPDGQLVATFAVETGSLWGGYEPSGRMLIYTDGDSVVACAEPLFRIDGEALVEALRRLEVEMVSGARCLVVAVLMAVVLIPTGAPIAAVTTPMGVSAPPCSVRPGMSASTRNAAPPISESGITRR